MVVVFPVPRSPMIITPPICKTQLNVTVHALCVLCRCTFTEQAPRPTHAPPLSNTLFVYCFFKPFKAIGPLCGIQDAFQLASEHNQSPLLPRACLGISHLCRSFWAQSLIGGPQYGNGMGNRPREPSLVGQQGISKGKALPAFGSMTLRIRDSFISLAKI